MNNKMLTSRMNFLTIILFLFITLNLSFATFSIVAVDPETGEVGSAGGSCIAGSIIISDIHINHGVIHTQSWYLSSNQDYASSLMNMGFSPEEIIELLILNDAQNNPGLRQYGVVDLVDGGRSAAFTGDACSDWKGHITGPTYAIQGNILLGPEILDGIENNFIHTSGSLAQKLMVALQGANVPGADTRCLDEGISTLSSFIRVARPSDDPNDLYLDLNVNNITPYYYQTGIWMEPIDSLQTLFDFWSEENIQYELGDINQDQVIDILDIVVLVNMILGQYTPTETELLLSDVNGDNSSNIQDIILIVNIIMR